jgi:2-oxoglutarate ferredoxin oxidoreductase subunit delta
MVTSSLTKHLINREYCKGCGICVHFCPKKVLAMDEEDKAVALKPENCIACRLCELRCPDLAIEIAITGTDPLNNKTDPANNKSEGGRNGK